MTTNNFRSVEERTVEASRIAREACENAYREGFEAARDFIDKMLLARAIFHEDKCRGAAESERFWHFPQMIALNGAAVDVRGIPTPTTKGGA